MIPIRVGHSDRTTGPHGQAAPNPAAPNHGRPPTTAGRATPLDARTPEADRRFRTAARHGLAGKPARTSPDDGAPELGYHWLTIRAAEASPFEPARTYTVAGTDLTGERLEGMRRDWLLLVLKRQLTSNGFCKKHGIDKTVLNALKREYPEDFTWHARRPAVTFAPKVVAEAVGVIERYHDGQMPYLELKRELANLGIKDWQHENLERQLPDGMRIRRRLASVFQQRRQDYFATIANDIEALLQQHDWVVGKQTDLLQILNADAAFKTKYPPKTRSGDYNLAWLGKLAKQERKEGQGRIAAVADRVKPEGKRGRPQPTGDHRHPRVAASPTTAVDGARGANAVRGPTLSDTSSVREQLQHLAAELKGKAPSEATLKVAIRKVEKQDGLGRSYRLWRLIMEKHKGVIPELQRWRVGAKNEITLRYLARWVVATHEAGPAASEAAVTKIFQKSEEYRQDPRVPDTKVFSHVKQNTEAGWDMAVVRRGRFQMLRNLLEALRTAPKDADFKRVLKTTKIQPQFDSYDNAGYYLANALKGGEWAEGLDARVLKAVNARSTRMIGGLGEKADPAFDPTGEPPWFPLATARKLLSIPRVEDSPLFLHAIDRLDGRLPFENNHVMVVYHRYSDIAALLDLFIRAGMSPKSSLFVSTPYPFDKAFDLQLADWGVPQIQYPVYDEKAFHASVLAGLRRMVEQYDERERKHGYGRPILVLDDGGEAASIIRTELKEHAHKLKVVEVTAAGHRITADLKAQHLRVPFVYYSIAYSEFKREVTSSFYAHRVVDRINNFSEVTDVKPANDRVVVIGGGPMGAFAARYWKKLGRDVAIVDRDPAIRAELLANGFTANEVFPDTRLAAALKNRGIVQSMCGFKDVIGPEHLGAIMDGALLVQGASKRNDFDMTAFEAAAKSKTEIPRRDDLPQKSFTYAFATHGEKKTLHFIGDGWTVNHDGSLHGTPFEDVQLETALIFESAVDAAGDSTAQTGDLKVVGAEVQEEYVRLWKQARRAKPR